MMDLNLSLSAYLHADESNNLNNKVFSYSYDLQFIRPATIIIIK
jgi:hypothetical protein